MALNSPNQDELDLRRRSRRRLIGAIALALAAVVVLPMIFDPEPKPLGANVDIQIPEQVVPPPAAPPAPPPAAQSPLIPSSAAERKPSVAPAPKAEAKPSAAPAAKAIPSVTLAPKAPANQVKAESKPVQAGATISDGKSFYLQLGSFASEANARQMIDKARKAGFKSDAMPVDGNFKVRVGPIAGRERALDYQVKLKAKGFDPVLVGP